MVWVLDLDGVVWLAEEAIPGAAEAVAKLREAGQRPLFLTNNSSQKVATLVEKLERLGVPVEPEDIVTSAQAAATLVEEGETVLVCADDGVTEAVEARGAKAVEDGPADAVIVGFHKHFDYGRLTAAFRAVQGGARLIGTNDDPTYPTPDGPIPGGGSLLAAVTTAAGVEATVAGKPHQPMADAVHERLDGASIELLVGDRPSTDGLMAQRLEVPFVLVFGGVTSADDLPVEPEPDMVADDLAALVDDKLGAQESA
jgi:HAD superfamily hydrolase (TIGR01450 family)